MAVRGAASIHSWSVPLKGVLRGLPTFLLPEDALYDALNVVLRDGTLRPRPGLVQHSAVDLLNRPMGAFSSTSLASGAFQADAFQNDAFQVSSNVPSSTLLVATTQRVWVFLNGQWTDITNSVLGGSEALPARFTMIEIGGVLNTLICNGISAPRFWDGSAATISNVAGSPPTFADFTTASDRIIGIIPPFQVRWGNALDIGTWPALNARTLADTPDPLRAIRNLGTQGVFVGKAQSLWTGLATGGTNAAAFRFELRAIVDGPAGSAAVVGDDVVLYYMTETGRVGIFDGVRHRWVADGAWDIVRAEIDTPNASRIFGVYEPITNHVIFHYPRVGDNGDLKGCLVVVPPRIEGGIADYIAFPCRMSVPVSAGTTRRTDARDALILRSDDRRSYIRTEDMADAGTAITGHWQTGLKPAPAGDQFRIDSIESFVARGVGFGSLTVKLITSDLLETEGGTVSAAKTIDLTASPVTEPKGFNARGAFVGLRYEFSTPITLRWHAARLNARRLE